MPQTEDTLRRELAALGVRQDGVVLVHASMKSLGRWVWGAEVAVVRALLAALGSGGTLVVPTMTEWNRDPAQFPHPVPEELWPEIRSALPPFDPGLTPGEGMGRISELVRRWPGAVRSGHPQSSFAAVGPAANVVVDGHDPSCHLGERSPLARLEDLDASVLLLGVGYDKCSCFHLAEYRQLRPPRRTYSCVVPDLQRPGRPDRAGVTAGRWFTYDDVDLDSADFPSLGLSFESESGAVSTGRVGLAAAKLFSLRDAVTFATNWMGRHRPRGVSAGSGRAPWT